MIYGTRFSTIAFRIDLLYMFILPWHTKLQCLKLHSIPSLCIPNFFIAQIYIRAHHTRTTVAIPTPLFACCVLLWKRQPLPLLNCGASSWFLSSLVAQPSIRSQPLLLFAPSWYYCSVRFHSAGSNRCSSTARHDGAAADCDSCLSLSLSCPCFDRCRR
jgi:hypothetical protein